MLDRKYFKTDLIYDRQKYWHPKMSEIAQFIINYLTVKKHEQIVFTETVTTKAEDEALNRVSDTHRTRRALDLSTKGMSLELIQELMEALKAAFGDLGAVVHGKPVIVIYHNSGHNWHFHVQLNRTFALMEIL